MVRAAYFDCFAGVSGDMILGALVDAGLPPGQLEAELGLLDLPGYRLAAEKVRRKSIAATRLTVEVGAEDQRQRTLEDIRQLVNASRLPADDKATIANVFERLAAAEATVHGESLEAVHFHDVGAIDAIVDVTGAVAGLRLLGIDEVYSSALPLGSGHVSGPHGVLPVPAPATLALLNQGSIPTRRDPMSESGELSTPTGVAILATIARFQRPAMSIELTGYGAGSRDPEQYPNVLRTWIGEKAAEAGKSRPAMLLIETNIDDMPAEQLAYAADRLLAAGAADAWLTPVQMKKGRPGTMLSLLCREELEDELARLIFRETTTFGLRVRRVWRHEAQRDIVRFQSSLGEVAVKVRRLPGEPLLVAPEYESCRVIAEREGLPLPQVMAKVRREAETKLGAVPADSLTDSEDFTTLP